MSWTFEWGYFNTEGCAISDNCSSYQGLCGVCLEFLPMWWGRNFLLSQRLYLHQLLFALLLNLLLIHMQVVPWRVEPCGLWFKRIFGETRDIILYFLDFLNACGNLFSYVFFFLQLENDESLIPIASPFWSLSLLYVDFTSQMLTDVFVGANWS